MSVSKDLTHQRFGSLVVAQKTDKRKDGNVVWKCLCDCGKTHYVMTRRLRTGNTSSCGCYRRIGRATGNRNVVLRPTQYYRRSRETEARLRLK